MMSIPLISCSMQPTAERPLDGSDELHLKVSKNSAKRGNVLILHGLTGTPSEVASLAQYLHQRNFEVYVPRLAGHGISIAELARTPAKRWLEDSTVALERFVDSDRFPPILIGLSFGALLAAHVAAVEGQRVKKLVLLSIPLKLRSKFKEQMLTALCDLPEFLLNILPTLKKSKRRPGCHALTHNAFPVHSIGAVARLVQIRRRVLRELCRISADTLLLLDPQDHHVSPDVPGLLAEIFGPERLRIELVPGGEHELTIGPCYRQVNELVYDFLNTGA